MPFGGLNALMPGGFGGAQHGGPVMTPGGGGTGSPLLGVGSLQPGQMPLGQHPDPSQWRNLPGYGMLQMLQNMQTRNPDIFSHMMQSPWAQKFGITADNLGSMESRQQARSDALGGHWTPPQHMFGNLPAPTAPAPAAPAPPQASIQAPVAAPAPGSNQFPTY